MKFTRSFLTVAELPEVKFPPYGGDAAVSWNSERDGPLSSPQRLRDFENSPIGKKVYEQMQGATRELALFLQRSGNGSAQRGPAVEAAIDQLEEFSRRLAGKSTGFFSSQIGMLYGEGKRSFDIFRAYANDESVPKSQRVKYLVEAMRGINVCGPGTVSNLAIAAQNLVLDRAGIGSHAKQAWEETLDQVIREYANQTHRTAPNFVGNEIHYVNAYRNMLAARYGYGIRERPDDFVPPRLGEGGRLDALMKYVDQRVNADSLVGHLAEECLERIQEDFGDYRGRLLSLDDVEALMARYQNSLTHEYTERYGKIDPTLLFTRHMDMDGEETYRLVEHRALLMRAIALNMSAAGLLTDVEFPVVKGQPDGMEAIRQVGDDYFLERHVPGGVTYQALPANEIPVDVLSLDAFMKRLKEEKDGAGRQALIRAYGLGPQSVHEKAARHAILTEAFNDGGQQAAYHLWHALQRGASGEILQYTEFVAEAIRNGLPMDVLGKLLLAQDSHGIAGLYDAMKQGYGETIDAYAKLVALAVNQGLPARQLHELLFAKGPAGKPALYTAMEAGQAQVIHQYLPLLKLGIRGGLSAEQLRILLHAKDQRGISGLYMALQNGDAQTIDEFANLVRLALQSGLPANRLGELLLAERPDGEGPGLFWALMNGHDGAITKYSKLVENAVKSGLPPAQLKALLFPKNKGDILGLYYAIELNKLSTIEAFAPLVKLAAQSGFSSEELKELLLIRRPDGIPGLQFTMQKGHAATINAYANMLGQVPQGVLSPNQWMELLSAKSPDGKSGLYHMLGEGRDPAIREYKKMLEHGVQGGLSQEQLKELLSAKRADGLPALHRALGQGQVSSVDEYANLLAFAVQNGLSQGDLKELLISKDPNGVPALYFSMQNGNASGVAAFAPLVKLAEQAGLSSADFKEILGAKRQDGFPGLYMMMQKGHVPALKKYAELIEAVPKDRLSPEDLMELLSAKSQDGIPGVKVAVRQDQVEAINAYVEMVRKLAKDRLTASQTEELLRPATVPQLIATTGATTQAPQSNGGLPASHPSGAIPTPQTAGQQPGGADALPGASGQQPIRVDVPPGAAGQQTGGVDVPPTAVGQQHAGVGAHVDAAGQPVRGAVVPPGDKQVQGLPKR